MILSRTASHVVEVWFMQSHAPAGYPGLAIPSMGLWGGRPTQKKKHVGQIGLTMRGGPVFLLSAQTFRWESSNPGSTSFLTG